MTRKTAIKLVLAMPVAHYAQEAKKRDEMAAILSGATLDTILRPTHFTLSKDGVSGITLRRGKEEITITFDEIFDALKP